MIHTPAIFPLNLIFEPFTFLDIGCSTPGSSVCFPLLELGCDGYFIDIEDFDGWDGRKFYKLDATKTNWDFIDKNIDYLSIDADKDSFKVLENIPIEKFGVRVITIEHDAYWGLKGRAENRDLINRQPQRKLLKEKGFKLICEDVTNYKGEIYEDWWVREDLYEYAKEFKCKEVEDRELLKKLRNTWEESTYLR
jgi:hypothetical protein